MKTKLFVLAGLLSGLFLFSCEDDDNLKNVDNQLQELFTQMYPTAQGVKWEMERGFYVADFWLDGYEAEAWFTKNYTWVMTEFDIRFTELPEAVKNAFNAGEYKDWRIDDVDKFVYADAETRYIIEVEQGEREVKLAYNEAGTRL